MLLFHLKKKTAVVPMEQHVVNFQLVSLLVNVKWVFVIFQNIFTDIPRQFYLNQVSLIKNH